MKTTATYSLSRHRFPARKRPRNHNLEEQALIFYINWFENGDSTSWKTTKLSHFFEVKTGKKDANYSVHNGDYTFFTCSQETLSSPGYSFDGAAIIMAGNGDFNTLKT